MQKQITLVPVRPTCLAAGRNGRHLFVMRGHMKPLTILILAIAIALTGGARSRPGMPKTKHRRF